MTWLVWRQHRQQASFALLGLVAIAAFLVPSGQRMHQAFQQTGLPECLRAAGVPDLVPTHQGCGQLGEQFAGRFQSLATVALMLLFLPLLIGLFWGAPLVAREVEHGTHRLVWTQGVTRGRWAAVKLGLVGGAVLLLAVAYALLMWWWTAPLNQATGYRFTWLFFDEQGPVLVGYALFALALGVLAGALTGKVLPAMAGTLVGFLATRLVVAILARPRFLPPQRRTFPVVGATETNQLAGDWVISRAVYSAQGVKLTPGWGSQALCDPASMDCAATVARYGSGAYNLEVFHPADRYWLFQGIETALFVALAVLLLLATVHWVRRRIA